MKSPNSKPAFTTRPVISGTFGVVTTTHWLASQAGMSILERGGNAYDAAVAAGFMLQVVEPDMNGLCGDLVAVFQARGEAPRVLCGQAGAPAGATIEHYRREGLDLVPGTGFLAAVVPGAFDAWMLMLRDYGTITIGEALEHALAYAWNGHPLTAGVTNVIRSVEALLRDEWTTSAEIYLPGGRVPQPGEMFVNRQLARTYERLLGEARAAGGTDRERQIEAARAAFYKGFIAEAIEAFVTGTEVMDVTGTRRRGVLTAADMAAWQATYENPVTYDYGGYTVCKAGPWSQGPVLLQVLALMKGFDLAAMDPDGPEFVHTLVEALKLAYADREAWYGDPNFVDVPIATLLSDEYNDARRRLIGDAASFEVRPGSPDGRVPRLPAAARLAAAPPQPVPSGGGQSAAASLARLARGPADGDTCHIDVIDRHGNIVAITPSGGWFQQSPVVPGLGFPVGTRGQAFWLEDGVPSVLGPGRRPRTTLTPTLALRNGGETAIAVGSPGGDGQDQWIAQFLLRHIEAKLNLQAAIDAPTLQTDHLPSSFHPRRAAPGRLALEGRLPAATIEELKRRGHEIQVKEDWSSLGRLCAASRNGRVLNAAATPRLQQAYAVGR